MGLLDDVLALPEGLDSQLLLGGRPLTSLQRTRLVLARAIVARPRLLLVDKTLDTLDPAALDKLCTLLFDRNQPWTLLVATHDPEVIRRCNQLIQPRAGAPDSRSSKPQH